MSDTLAREVETPSDWVACEGCHNIIYGKRWLRELCVCRDCGRHARVTARVRVDQLLDPDGREPLPSPATPVDPLSFVDRVPYLERVAAARRETGLDEAVVCCRGRIGGRPVVLAVMDFRFLGGSLGCGVGERITRAAEESLRLGVPLIVVTASGGARMQEGALSLMQMVKTSQALAQLDEAGILTVAVITDPTYGGVAASFASLTDVIIAEPGARLGFAGPRVIEQTIRRSLPKGFQSAEFMAERGLVDQVVPRDRLVSTLARLIDIAGAPVVPPIVANGRTPAKAGNTRKPGARTTARASESAVIREPSRLSRLDPWEVVQRARHLDRPNTLDYVGYLCDGFIELGGDRNGQNCPALVGGLGRLAGTPVMLIGHQKGHSTRELVQRNFGMPTPAGYRKAARMMRLAEKLRLPIVTLIDTPGAYPGPEAEEQGQAIAIAENIRLMSRLTVPIIAVVTGEGGSGGALALGVADRVYLLEYAIYSVISPEGCAAILWQSPTSASTAATALRLTAPELLELGVVDGVVPEPAGGAHTDHPEAAEALGRAIQAGLAELIGIPAAELVARRRRRFRGFGAGEYDPT